MKKSNIFRSDSYLDKSYIDKELTFEEICPIWAKKIRKGLDRKDKKVLASDSKYCIVGEAWGYSGKQAGYYFAPLIPFIGCWSCIKFGRKFAFFAKKDIISSINFNILISEFLQHWNKKHKSITKANL